MAKAYRDRLPALVLVALLHVVAVYVFLNAIVIEPQRARSGKEEHETQITLMREPPAPTPPVRKRHLPAAGGSTAITTPFFNPYTYNTPTATRGTADGIAMALSACDLGHYDLASAEVRTMCDRIGALLKSDPGRFGFTTHVVDPQHWQTELARREAPVLAPCMSPNGIDVLYTLKCVYQTVFVGYDSENRRRYSQ